MAPSSAWPVPPTNPVLQMLVCTIEDLMIFGIHTVVFAHHNINVEIGIDHLSRSIVVIGIWQDNVTVATEKAARLVIISNMYSKPGIPPEIAQLVFFREPCARSPAHFSARWGPDDKILVTHWYMIALPTGPLAAINQQFLDASR